MFCGSGMSPYCIDGDSDPSQLFSGHVMREVPIVGLGRNPRAKVLPCGAASRWTMHSAGGARAGFQPTSTLFDKMRSSIRTWKEFDPCLQGIGTNTVMHLG